MLSQGTAEPRTFSDHWPVTYVKVTAQETSWKNQNNSILKGWRPKTESDESEFVRMIVEGLEDAEDLTGEVSIEDITKNMPMAAKAIEFESAGGRNRLVKRTPEHLGAEKNLRGKEGEELQIAKQNCLSKEGSTRPEEYCRRHRRSDANRTSVTRCTVEEEQEQRATEKNVRRGWKATRGRSTRMTR